MHSRLKYIFKDLQAYLSRFKVKSMLPLGVFEQSIRRSKVFRAFIAESTRRMDSEFGFDIIFLYGAVEFGLNFFISSCIVKCYVVLLVLT